MGPPQPLQVPSEPFVPWALPNPFQMASQPAEPHRTFPTPPPMPPNPLGPIEARRPHRAPQRYILLPPRLPRGHPPLPAGVGPRPCRSRRLLAGRCQEQRDHARGRGAPVPELPHQSDGACGAGAAAGGAELPHTRPPPPRALCVGPQGCPADTLSPVGLRVAFEAYGDALQHAQGLRVALSRDTQWAVTAAVRVWGGREGVGTWGE